MEQKTVDPNVTIFDNIRWAELATGLTLLTTILSAIQAAPMEPQVKVWLTVAISVLGSLAHFLRNPKKLEWVAPEGDKDAR